MLAMWRSMEAPTRASLQYLSRMYFPNGPSLCLDQQLCWNRKPEVFYSFSIIYRNIERTWHNPCSVGHRIMVLRHYAEGHCWLESARELAFSCNKRTIWSTVPGGLSGANWSHWNKSITHRMFTGHRGTANDTSWSSGGGIRFRMVVMVASVVRQDMSWYLRSRIQRRRWIRAKFRGLRHRIWWQSTPFGYPKPTSAEK